jgi:hypothetical protein
MDTAASQENLLRRFDSKIVTKLAVIVELMDDEIRQFPALQ